MFKFLVLATIIYSAQAGVIIEHKPVVAVAHAATSHQISNSVALHPVPVVAHKAVAVPVITHKTVAVPAVPIVAHKAVAVHHAPVIAHAAPIAVAHAPAVSHSTVVHHPVVHHPVAIAVHH